MKKFYLALCLGLVICMLLPSAHAVVRGLLLESGFSWMLSEWAYYVMLVLFGIVSAVILLRSLTRLKSWAKGLIALLMVALPFLMGFARHPIYEDMLWDLSTDMTSVQTAPDYNDVDLVVIAIADCPFCKRAVSELRVLHERKPDLRLRMVVCTADSSWLEPYVLEAGGSFEVVMASDMDVLATHAGGHFPAYVLVRDDKPVCRWTNNEWGPRAKDIVEKDEGRGAKDEVR